MPADITPLIPQGRQSIRSYGVAGFLINESNYRGTVLVFPDRVLTPGISTVAALRIEDLTAVVDAVPRVELLLVGCGPTMLLLGRELRAQIRAKGVAVDTMATPAACRTYNVLMAEDRRVAALLFPIEP